MKKVSDKFDALDTKLDDLESKRGQLRQVLVPGACFVFSGLCCWSRAPAVVVLFLHAGADRGCVHFLQPRTRQTLSKEPTTALGRLNQVIEYALAAASSADNCRTTGIFLRRV